MTKQASTQRRQTRDWTTPRVYPERAQHTVTLIRGRLEWYALFGGLHAQSIRRIYGKAIVATGFSAQWPATAMVQSMQLAYADSQIILGATREGGGRDAT